MKIGIDIKAALGTKRSGIGNYVYHLVKNLLLIDNKNYYFFYTSDTNTTEFKKDNVTFLNRGNPFSFLKSTDVFHGPDFKLLPVRTKKKIVTIHDLASFKNEDFMSDKFKKLTQNKINKSIKDADLIVTISNSIKEEILQHYKIDNHKVETVYLGVNDSTLKKPNDINKNESEIILKSYGISKPFFLFTANLENRKNVTTLIRSFSLFKEKQKSDHQLVLVGKHGYGYENIRNEIDKNSFKKDIIEVGWIEDYHLSVFYSNAEMFIYPTLYEGFGFPILDAMRFGLPVICSNIPVLKEIASGAVLFADPNSPEDFSDSINKLLSDSFLKNELINKGFEKVKYFSWEKTAKKMIEIYES